MHGSFDFPVMRSAMSKRVCISVLFSGSAFSNVLILSFTCAMSDMPESVTTTSGKLCKKRSVQSEQLLCSIHAEYFSVAAVFSDKANKEEGYPAGLLPDIFRCDENMPE